MLGQMVIKYFGSKVKKVITLEKRFNQSNALDFTSELKKYPDAIVINCIGKISQKTNNPEALYTANSFLPLVLKDQMLDSQLLIHPSSDCVFSGKKGKPYNTNDCPDAKDTYGWSKTLGEQALTGRMNTVIMRVSIIGLDNSNNSRGLLGWFLSNPKNSKLKGYSNHFWNGITTLEWCKQAERLINNHKENEQGKLIQFGTKEYYSKYEMLQLFQEVFKTEFEISKFETSENVDKRLVPNVCSENLKNQLTEMKNIFAK